MEIGDERDQLSVRDAIVPCTAPNHFLVLLPADGFHFAGAFRFQCLYGSIKVAGSRQNGGDFAENRFVPFATHNKAQVPLCFLPRDSTSISLQDNELIRRVESIVEGGIERLNHADRYVAAIVVDVAPSMLLSFMMSRLGNFTKPLDKYKSINVSGECYIVQGIKTASLIEELPPYIHNEVSILDAIRFVMEHGYSLMVAGPKGAGKSTLNRFIANRFLSHGKTLFLLDTDVGQTEFTPPGCVTLTRVKTSILTPPFLHQSSTLEDSICLGTLSPGNCISDYYAAVEQLYQRYQELHNSNTVLLINTHGWIEGIGGAIMTRMLEVIRPTLVINLVVEGTPSFDIPMISSTQQFLQYSVQPRMNDMTAREITPRAWRDFATTAYFATCLDDPQFGAPSSQRTLANVNSYRVAFDKVALHVHRDRPFIADHLLLAAINCTIVALCGFESAYDKKNMRRRYMCNNPELPVLMETAIGARRPLFRCFGFGFVRAIAPDRRLIYLISPISPIMCAQVEVLIVPNGIHTPSYMLDQDPSNSTPYMVQTRTDAEYRMLVSEQPRVVDGLQSKLINTTSHRAATRVLNPRSRPTSSSMGGGGYVPGSKRTHN